jgi:hypothetical protein
VGSWEEEVEEKLKLWYGTTPLSANALLLLLPPLILFLFLR